MILMTTYQIFISCLGENFYTNMLGKNHLGGCPRGISYYLFMSKIYGTIWVLFLIIPCGTKTSAMNIWPKRL